MRHHETYESTLCHLFLLKQSLSDSGAAQVKPNGGNQSVCGRALPFSVLTSWLSLVLNPNIAQTLSQNIRG